MSDTFHEQSIKASRKVRRCDWCGELIQIGQPCGEGNSDFGGAAVSDTTPQQQRRDIRKAGFLPGESAGHSCSDCGRGCGRGWWVRTSYEYNEWEGYCRECAYRYAHKWDDPQEGQQ